jgi:hypothetical protein
MPNILCIRGTCYLRGSGGRREGEEQIRGEKEKGERREDEEEGKGKKKKKKG